MRDNLFYSYDKRVANRKMLIVDKKLLVRYAWEESQSILYRIGSKGSLIKLCQSICG